MRTRDVNETEMRDFIASVTDDERRYYDVEPERIVHTSVFSKGIEVDRELVAVGGIARWYRLFHYPWYVVKTRYQGRGIGSQLVGDLFSFAEKHSITLLLVVVERENTASVKILNAQGCRKIVSKNSRDYVYRPFNRWGELAGRYVLPVVVRMYLSPVGGVLRVARRSRQLNKIVEGY